MQVFIPSQFFLLRKGPEEIVQRSIKALTLPVTLGLKRCGSALLYTIHFTQLLHELSLKAPTLIRMNPSWNTVSMNPLLDQDLCYCYSPLIGCGNSNCEFRKYIRYHKYIFFSTLGVFQHRKIQCHHFQGFWRLSTVHNCSYFRLNIFRHNATKTIFAKVLHILVHPWPIKSLTY